MALSVELAKMPVIGETLCGKPECKTKYIKRAKELIEQGT